jgi:hypothetical protein
LPSPRSSRLDPAIGGRLRNHGATPSSTGLVQERGVDAAVPELMARGAVNSHGPKRLDHDRASAAHGRRPDQPISGVAREARKVPGKPRNAGGTRNRGRLKSQTLAARRPQVSAPAGSAMTWLTAEPAEMPVPGTCLGIGLATAASAGGAGLPYGAPAKLRVIAHPHGRSRPRRRSCRVSRP